jgi:hypothetical protein
VGWWTGLLAADVAATACVCLQATVLAAQPQAAAALLGQQLKGAFWVCGSQQGQLLKGVGHTLFALLSDPA